MPNTKQGSVASLWRYPVKSMLGEELSGTEVTERGLVGDRAYALMDGVDPDGTTATSQQADFNQVLSKALNRTVTLNAAGRGHPGTVNAEEYWPDIEGLDFRDTVTDFGLPEGTFFDCAMVHLLTTATLDRLHQLYPQGRFEIPRFRPNIVVTPASGEKDFVENAWGGHTLAIGDSVRLSITGPCGRCVMTTLAQGDLPRDPGILRTVAQHNKVNVGVYATVERGGMIHRGDAVRVE